MPTLPPKSPFRCPVCGFVQLEPPHLISTNCRSCGAHYEVSKSAQVTASGTTELPSFSGKKQDAGKPVHCLKCGRTHNVSNKAQSTICPGCYAPIELIDVSITAHSSRAVDTRGHLKITSKGSLSNSWIVCGTARIEGSFNGHLRCEGEARFSMQKNCTGSISAGCVLVEKKTVLECAHPIDADRVIVEGTLNGTIKCRGIVQVGKSGKLEGPVEALAMVVEKGGIYYGECRIKPPAVPLEAAPAAEEGTPEDVEPTETPEVPVEEVERVAP